MRIGELAALVGVSTRTVRYYHHLGLLPEPVRLANGYRDYRVRDAVSLARIRRLAELGLSLDELRDVLADDEGRDMREVLMELDADLAREQEAIALRRERLAALLEGADLRPDSMMSADLAAVLREFSAEGSKMAELDRDVLTLMGSIADPASQEQMLDLMRPLIKPDALERGRALYARLDDLADADPGDDRVAALADELAAYIPDEMASMMVTHLGPAAGRARPPGSGPGVAADGGHWLGPFAAEVSPAQTEVFRLAMIKLRERA